MTRITSNEDTITREGPAVVELANENTSLRLVGAWNSGVVAITIGEGESEAAVFLTVPQLRELARHLTYLGHVASRSADE